MKIINVLGARPNFIKYFPLSLAIKEQKAPVEDMLVHTGQHYDYLMSKVFFDEMGIKETDYHFEVGSGTHGQQTGEILRRAEEIFIREKPDVVIVYGDVNSTVAAALAAVKLRIPVGHVEAGYRSFNRKMPEEINRILTDHVSTYLFCPSERAVANLKNEGLRNAAMKDKLVPIKGSAKAIKSSPTINAPLIVNVGNIMYDAMRLSMDASEKRSGLLKDLGLVKKEYMVLTVHRPENTDDMKALSEIIEFVKEVSSGRDVVFPMHPRLKKTHEQIRVKFSGNIRAIDPVSYFDMLTLNRNSKMILTDSGGMQEEAFWLKVPCITLRRETERTETIDSGWNVLYKDYRGKHRHTNRFDGCYGDGNAAARIIDILSGIV